MMINNIVRKEEEIGIPQHDDVISGESCQSKISEGSSVGKNSKSCIFENGYQESSGKKPQENISVSLEDNHLWQAFSKHVNEMIVTRSGRRLFPVYKIKVDGLDPNEMYQIELDFQLIGPYRWKYIGGEWLKSLRSDLVSSGGVYIHPDSPNFGTYWMRSPVCFSRVKITNREPAIPGTIFLHSMYKYNPRLIIKRIDRLTKYEILVGVFKFKETEFIAVTAYQNDQVTELKVMNNPFAKAFQDPIFVSPDLPARRNVNYGPQKNGVRKVECRVNNDRYVDRYRTYFNPPIPQTGYTPNLKSFPRNYFNGLQYYNVAPSPYQTAGGMTNEQKFNYNQQLNLNHTYPFNFTDMYNRNIIPNYIRQVYPQDMMMNQQEMPKNIPPQIYTNVPPTEEQEQDKKNEDDSNALNLLAMVASQEKLDNYKF